MKNRLVISETQVLNVGKAQFSTRKAAIVKDRGPRLDSTAEVRMELETESNPTECDKEVNSETSTTILRHGNPQSKLKSRRTVIRGKRMLMKPFSQWRLCQR